MNFVMKKKEREFNFWSLLWTLLLHGGVVLLLLFLHLNKPVLQAESGLPVELGDMGNLDTDYEFTDISELPAPTPVTVPQPTVPDADVTITQDLEETVTIESGEKENPVEAVETPKQPTPEEIQAEQERQAVEQVRNQVLDAFGRSSTMQPSAPMENNSDVLGTPGDERGNSNQGNPQGVGGSGPILDLTGRSFEGTIPLPSNKNIPEQALVVVTIWVDADGNVTRASINKRTSTINADLRQRSLDAARRTKFNKLSSADPSVEDATGTITYFYVFTKGD